MPTFVENEFMKFARHQLDKAGLALIGTDPFLRNQALPIIQEWRETHFHVLQELHKQLLSFFSVQGVTYRFSSMRIKRMTSIEVKLRSHQGGKMKLGGMQDIGGIRFVFDTIEELDKVCQLLNDFIPQSFDLVRSQNYVESPKASGYRSIHYVYKYKDSDPVYDDLSIELQIRTSLQHSWAMAVETASLISQTSLKSDVEDGSEWRGFFKLVSTLFARKEHKPINVDYVGYTEERLCEEYFHYEKHNLTDQLKALRVTTGLDFTKVKNGYCVLTVDFINKVVHAHMFPHRQEREATKLFGEIEHAINKDEAALMVGIEDMEKLMEAYPSYFLDTKKFLWFLADFERQCKALLNKG